MILKQIVLTLLRGYKRFISPLLPPACRFQPTCSEYGLQAVRHHGVFKGLCLLTWRLLRCQPFGRPGPDPVPEPRRWRPDAGVRARDWTPGA